MWRLNLTHLNKSGPRTQWVLKCNLYYVADIQFHQFLRSVSDLSSKDVYGVFDMLDVDGSGEIELDEFYLLMCILIATKVRWWHIDGLEQTVVTPVR